MGYDKPNYTQIPNLLLDVHMKEMGEAELKVCLAIARQTFGWHKQRDRISLTQLMELTGMSRQGVLNGIGEALKRGVILREESGQSFFYSLLVNEVDQLEPISLVDTSQRSRPELVNEVDRSGPRSRHTKETNKRNKETSFRNSQSATPPSLVSGSVKGSGEALPSSPQLPQDPPSPRKGKAPTHPLYQDTLATHKRLALEYEGTTNDKGETVCTSLSAHGRIATGIKAWCEAGLTPEQYETVYREVQGEGWLTGPLYPQLVLAKASKILRGRSPNGHSKHVSNGFESWLLTTWNMSSPSVVAMMEGISETELKQRYEIQKRGTP